MKLKQWLYGAAALAMLAACSDKDIAPDTGGEVKEEESGYIGVRIQMPTVPSSRANDVFEDGEPSEYALNTASLILFRCDEDAVKDDDGEYDPDKDVPQIAKCIGAFDLRKSKDYADENPNKQITTQVIRFANVTGMEKNDKLKLYALVMANGLDYKLTPSTLNAYKGKTIKFFQELISTEMLYTQTTPGVEYASSIFMSNSPLSSYMGGAVNPNTQLKVGESQVPVLPVLVEIDKTTYKTEQEAIQNPAGIIHIERAVAKVTCSSFTKETSIKVTVGDKTYSLEVDDVYWDLCQDMEKTYLVRNTNRTPVTATSDNPGSANPDGTNPNGNMWAWNLASDYAAANLKYRMLGHEPLAAGSDIYYRPYFCQVPGYGVGKGDEKDNYENKTFRNKKTPVKDGGNEYFMDPDDAVEWDAKSAFYPHENTFPVKYMKYANTTRIGFWVTFKFKQIDADGNVVNGDDNNPVYLDMDGKDFFVRGLDRSTIYLENPLEAIAGEYLKGKAEIKTAVEAAIKKTEGQASGYDNLDLTKLLDFKWGDSADADGQRVITSISFKDVDALNELYDNIIFNEVPAYTFTAQDLAKLNALEAVYKYKGGKAFYEVRIKHFGNDLTPWNLENNDQAQASTITQSYGETLAERKRNYLGRYGIVRNNWYDLNVSTIKRLGPPVDPAKWEDAWPGKPDDNKDEYIAVILRVLSWAKRTQQVDF